jgi:hypothetical protein
VCEFTKKSEQRNRDEAIEPYPLAEYGCELSGLKRRRGKPLGRGKGTRCTRRPTRRIWRGSVSTEKTGAGDSEERRVREFILLGGELSVCHQMFGTRSKYSSSSFMPPSPSPTNISDSINSRRSIHFIQSSPRRLFGALNGQALCFEQIVQTSTNWLGYPEACWREQHVGSRCDRRQIKMIRWFRQCDSVLIQISIAYSGRITAQPDISWCWRSGMVGDKPPGTLSMSDSAYFHQSKLRSSRIGKPSRLLRSNVL